MKMGFCNQCGNQLNGEKFCPHCGAKAEPELVQPPIYSASGKKPGGKRKGIIMTAAVLVVAVAATFFLTGRGYKRTVNSFVKASIDGDVKKIVSLLPGKVEDYIIEEEYDGDRDEFLSDSEEEVGGMHKELERLGVDKSDISFEIVKAEDFSEEDLEDLNDEFKSDGIDLNIKAAKEVTVKLKVLVSGQEQTNNISFDVGKIGRSWYIVEI